MTCNREKSDATETGIALGTGGRANPLFSTGQEINREREGEINSSPSGKHSFARPPVPAGSLAPASKGKPMTADDHSRWREGMSRWHREADKRAEQYGCFDPDDDCG